MLVFRVDNRSHQTREQKPAQSTLNDGQKGYRGRKRMGRDAECRKGRLEAAILREFVDKKPGPRACKDSRERPAVHLLQLNPFWSCGRCGLLGHTLRSVRSAMFGAFAGGSTSNLSKEV
ncbi:unnamed protein product [Durusdinium trenchii]|uniref:Uncharacterized protein n=1 Tax=Durusdinium trenchii TaxID=1381693 RepID=A0ABP0RHF8_9DINO